MDTECAHATIVSVLKDWHHNLNDLVPVYGDFNSSHDRIIVARKLQYLPHTAVAPHWESCHKSSTVAPRCISIIFIWLLQELRRSTYQTIGTHFSLLVLTSLSAVGQWCDPGGAGWGLRSISGPGRGGEGGWPSLRGGRGTPHPFPAAPAARPGPARGGGTCRVVTAPMHRGPVTDSPPPLSSCAGLYHPIRPAGTAPHRVPELIPSSPDSGQAPATVVQPAGLYLYPKRAVALILLYDVRAHRFLGSFCTMNVPLGLFPRKCALRSFVDESRRYLHPYMLFNPFQSNPQFLSVSW